ncbi:bifunctional phosphoribosylaminoimidazolecarboxamide formyltransferase/IMP cyclohydrolase [Desulfurispira natronophila]|uniref:Bifunctional purine biosynthesis protein PurH n=1 Tax=Desulfurispira natronophila TaxID=682562 RepID=A0A7W8DGF2_9BACT|nr:bifunctional phosphoribosylaminoimidazolecarboxamide formyltransferase/IMP cyclohydrolase [Desulfurispira natronophila]MBB5021436.1 phosphoribosylaminoimidazolecarboxamide formyltransferase/IMP cyclohydrolase [Desulfurispira natronophila]
MQNDIKIQRALISVSDKAGVADFARFLNANSIEILSTGGTARLLQESQVPVIEVGEYTGTREMLDGRVKTLHPKVHGGILGMRNSADHCQQMKEAGIETIDIVVVNLYPFEQTVKKGCSYEEAVENIDIGGPTMLRSAAKNHRDVVVIVDPCDYKRVQDEIEKTGTVSWETRRDLARKVFLHTAHYDAMISDYFNQQLDVEFPETFTLSGRKLQDLRYGENPHQNAAFYGDTFTREASVASARQLHGKALSYNNIIDADAALELVKEFDETAVVIIKHTNPCGTATGSSVLEAYHKALSTDPLSAFGGVIAINKAVDQAAAEEMAKLFVEIIIAPSFSEEALSTLTRKKNIRLLECGALKDYQDQAKFVRKVTGGFVVQDRDLGMVKDMAQCTVPTAKKPTEEEYRALAFAWRVCKHVKSNAIVYARDGQLVGVGAGQMSRVDSSRIGAERAQLAVEGTVMASDAFFPFRDGIDAAAKVGVTAIVQPGGSVRDEEIIEACNEHGIAMILTGMRHFRH